MTTSISPFAQVRIVARREIDERLHARSFILVTVIFAILIIAGVLLGGRLLASSTTGSGTTTTVAVASGQPAAAGLAQVFTVTPVASDADAIAAVQAGTVDAAVVAGATGGVDVVALTKAPADLVNVLTVTPGVRLLAPSQAVNPILAMIVPLIFGLVFMIVTLMSVQSIATNTVVEKQTCIVEILLGSMSATVLLAGKVIGNSIAAFLQTIVMAAAALIALVASGKTSWPGMMVAPILWFVAFFIVGFILMAALGAGLASLVSRQEDVATAISPLTFIVMLPYLIPYILGIAQNWHGLAIASYIPIISTVALPTRLAFGQGTWWQALISLALLIVTTVLAVVAAARVYRYSLLLTGKKISFRTALRGAST